jgi:hypothetical protein
VAINYTQTDSTSGVCLGSSFCSLVAADGSGGMIAADGGTPGTGTTSVQKTSSQDETAGDSHSYTIIPAAGTSWDGGTWTVRVNVTTANMNLSITAIYICRVDSGCANQATIGSATGLSISLSSTGVKSQTVTGSAQTPGVGDKVVVLIGIANGAMSTQSVVFTNDQNIDSPFTQASPSLLWDPLAPFRPHLVRRVRDFFLGGLPPKLAKLHMKLTDSGLWLPANDPAFGQRAHARPHPQFRKVA